MSRVQLSINVSDFDAAVAFYSRLFGAAPAKLRPGYANFAIDDPPLKLVLNSPGQRPRRGDQSPRRRGQLDRGSHRCQGQARKPRAWTLNPSRARSAATPAQDKAWVRDPDGLAWEYYTVLEHIETP